MGRGEARRGVRLACDDLDVAGRFARGGPVGFTERCDFRREPPATAERGRQGAIVPRGGVVVGSIRIRLKCSPAPAVDLILRAGVLSVATGQPPLGRARVRGLDVADELGL